MRSVLITGISGFIGGHLWAELAQRHDNVWGIFGNSGKLPLRPERQLFADLKSHDHVTRIISGMAPECIVHLAAVSRVSVCQKQSLLAWRINHAATRHLAKLAEEINARFIFISSDQVFDGLKGMYRETDPAFPVNVYGETKKSAEKTLLATVTNAVVARINNCFGPPRFRGSSFSNWILEKEFIGDPVTLFNDQIRSPLDVVTLCNALIELIEHPFIGTMHLGGSEPETRVSFGRKLLRHQGRDSSGILEVSAKQHDPDGIMPADTSFDISLARNVLNTPMVDVEKGLDLAYGPANRFF
ncbi:MAG: SDR family oxidoreductase [Candidatus Electryonea clarkiae]|nr:SDR family oxidoreductase [Candidatus Electryonea clarkiae]MDP8288771.1 SDR family oxidoreductase [Candidatus Electryonea clarkiae]